MSDTEKAQPTFKAGDKALLEVEIEKYGEATATVGYGLQWMIVNNKSLHPAPREGEYRLTVEELYRLVSDFVYEATDAPFFGDCPEENIEFIKQWLANRKEAGND